MVVIDGPDNFPEWERRQNEAASAEGRYAAAAEYCQDAAARLRAAVAPLRKMIELAQDEQYREGVTQKDAGLGQYNFEEIRHIVEDLFKGDAK